MIKFSDVTAFFKITRPAGFVGFLITGVVVFTIVATVVGAISRNVNASQKPQQPVYAPVRSAQTQTQNQPQQAAEDKQPEKPYYGQTYYEGKITSVYFYPEGSEGHPGPATHIKFDHSEELDVWLCGDQRPKIVPGSAKRRLFLSYEPNTVCVTNWQLH